MQKYYRDLKNVVDSARDEGLEEGKVKGLEEAQLTIAKNLLDILDNETIALKTGLPIERIETLRLT